MKLLDKPIRKTAEVTNKEAIAKMLMGAGAGAGVGVLGEFMLTGKLGWKGGALGAAVGTGASAFLNPEAREKLVSTVKEKFASEDVDESELGAIPGEGITLGGADGSKGKEPTDEQYYNNFKQQLESGQELPEDQIAGMQEFITEYDQHQVGLTKAKEDIATAVEMQKDPKFNQSLEIARSGEYLDKLTPGADEDVSPYVYRYVNDYTREMGKAPTPEHILRFTRDTRLGALPQEEWGDYMTDQHEMSGYEGGTMSGAVGRQVLPQMGGSLAMRKGVINPLIKKNLQTTAGKKSLEKVFGRESVKQAAKKIGVKGSAKLGAKAIPGLNILLDIPELLIDPRTGEYRTDALKNPGRLSKILGQNISEQDRLMGLRENKGRMLTGDKRSMMYNMSAGALRGWFNPVTSAAVFGKRYKDTASAGIDNIKDRGFLQGGISNAKAGASALATTGSELWSPIQDAMWWQKKAVKPKSYSWGADVAAPTKKEIREHRQANKWHRKEGEDHMDKIELVRRVIRKQASLQKEAINLGPKVLKNLHPSNIPAPSTVGSKSPYYKAGASYSKLKDWASKKGGYKVPGLDKVTRSGATKGLALAGGATAATSYMLGGDDLEDQRIKNAQPVSDDEIQDARDKRGNGDQSANEQVEGEEIPQELLAGAGGAVAGGAAGYALAPTLGISRATGAVGGATLTAIASALLAHKLKKQKTATA
jgi:hypothetical protein